MIKKYEFPSQAVAYSELGATFNSEGKIQVEGAENAVDMGHWPIVPAVYVDEVEVTPALLSAGYLVDIMWLGTPPAHLVQYEVSPNSPKHTFA